MSYGIKGCQTFCVPPDFDPRCVPRPDDKVCVVAIVGKSGQSSYHCKASVINSLIDADIFSGERQNDDAVTKDLSAIKHHIDGFYDAERRVIYLHLLSAFDASTLGLLYSSVKGQDTDAVWRDGESAHARALLFLLSLSHILLFVQPGLSFDVSCVRLFRVLETIRPRIQQEVSDLLSSLPLSADWTATARLCSPRALFLFDSHILASRLTAADSDGSQVKRLQHAMEDQIYRILRKARIITNISNNSLFAVPVNQEFVYIREPSTSEDPIRFYLGQLEKNCQCDPGRGSFATTSRAPPQPAPPPASSPSPQKGGFHRFLSQHIELAQTKGFDDNMRKNATPCFFELPTYEQWMLACRLLHPYFFRSGSEESLSPHFSSLQSLLDVDIRFSESRCSKVLPLAAGSYQENLPQHYTASFHLNKLNQARRLFLQHARGSAADKYLDQLTADCEAMWRAGRQLCEESSLTGRHCVNPLHRVAQGSKSASDRKSSLPTMPHCSQMKWKAACNCGRRQAEMDDPFDYKTANYDYYESLATQCCVELDKVTFAVCPAAEGSVVPPGGVERKSSISAASPDEEGSCDTSATSEVVEEAAPLVGMVNTNTPDGLLPAFPSWSLMLLGKYSTYIPSQGLDQPGFLHGSGYLLPWDFTTQPDKWPSISETKKSKSRKSLKDVKEGTVRLYFGLEYECPRGHRFFLSGRDKVLKCGPSVAALGPQKDYTAHKLMTTDMPLYFACHCRTSKGFVAQLMRVYVALPESLCVELRVRVHAAPPPGGAVFLPPGGRVALTRPGLWVLRLPCYYVGEKGPCLAPSDPLQLAACHVAKGIFVIRENHAAT